MLKSVFRRQLGLIWLAALMLMGLPTATRAQTNSQTSLAYVDASGNVIVVPPGAGQGTPVTNDANFTLSPGAAPTHNYTHLRWSPDGSKLAFQDSITGSLYIAISGQPNRSVATGTSPEYPPAWLPDGSAIAYVVNTQQAAGDDAMMMAIQQVPVVGGQPQTVGSFVETQGCGGSGGDQPSIRYFQETALNGNALTFAWTKGGWLYSLACNGIGLALTGFSNLPQWKADGVGRAVVSPGGTRAAGVQFGQDMKPASLAFVDLATGKVETTFTVPGIDQVGWSADETQVLYSTLDGQTVSLWKSHRGGQATQVFSDQGRYIGAISSSPDSQSILFSYIPAGDDPQIQILSIPMSGVPANRSTASVIADGGRPTFSPTPSSAVSPTPMPPSVPTLSPVPPVSAVCTPRTDWAYTYTIVSGDTLASVARRTNTAIDVLAAGNCLSNANVIYVGQVLRVPVAVQAQQPSGGRIQFPAGATSVTVRGQLAASGSNRWVLKAAAGQTLSAQLGFHSGQAILIIWGADGTVLISDHAGATSFSGVLPVTEDYYIDVRGNPSTPTSYTLTVTIPPLPAPAPTTARRIQFAAGAISATVQSQLVASGSDRWVLKAGAGQTLSVQLGFFSGQAVLVIWGADGTVLLSDHAGASSFVGVLPLTEDYYIDVRGFSSSPTSYTLTVTIPPR